MFSSDLYICIYIYIYRYSNLARVGRVRLSRPGLGSMWLDFGPCSDLPCKPLQDKFIRIASQDEAKPGKAVLISEATKKTFAGSQIYRCGIRNSNG